MSFKTGILLINLGTPNSPETKDVRKYLRQFLMDKRVIDSGFISRWLLVNLIIAPFRSPKSAKAYQKLWTAEGSPLKVHGMANAKTLQARLGENYVVNLAMRYQHPSIARALADFQTQNVSEIVVIPLFPQYASASTGSVYEELTGNLRHWQNIPKIRFISNFYSHPLFIQGFAENARKHLETENFDHLIFSYHGLPERQIKKADLNADTCTLGRCCDQISPKNQFCYRAQCMATTRLLAEKLNLKEGTYTTSFQSRLGKEPWVQPYTDDLVKSLAQTGVSRVLAFSPAFVADCLETSIEVAEEYKELFLEHGGKSWQLVESLNNSEIWIDLLEDLVRVSSPSSDN